MEHIKFVVKNTSVRNGRIDHVDIGDATIVDCTNCTSLTELPLWPNVTEVWCTNCPSLTELPLWSNVTEVWCYNCPSLTELPLWPNVTKVLCTNCPSLTELPLWHNVTKVWCSNCPSLTELPLWPNVTEVWCENCPSLTELPLWPNVTIVFSNLPVKFKPVYTLVDPNKTIYSSQSEKCCICMENPKEIIFDPCYHFDTCIKCAEQLVVVVSSKCPICRTRITSLINNLSHLCGESALDSVT